MPSKDFLALNPDYAETDPRKIIAARRKALEKAAGIEGSPLEREFLRRWREVDPRGELQPRREYRFSKTRLWRCDFAWPDRRVYVEMEGGTWTRGRHLRPVGFAGDCEKYNAATLLGWAGFRIPTGGVKPKLIQAIHEFIRARQQAVAGCPPNS